MKKVDLSHEEKEIISAMHKLGRNFWCGYPCSGLWSLQGINKYGNRKLPSVLATRRQIAVCFVVSVILLRIMSCFCNGFADGFDRSFFCIITKT